MDYEALIAANCKKITKLQETLMVPNLTPLAAAETRRQIDELMAENRRLRQEQRGGSSFGGGFGDDGLDWN